MARVNSMDEEIKIEVEVLSPFQKKGKSESMFSPHGGSFNNKQGREGRDRASTHNHSGGGGTTNSDFFNLTQESCSDNNLIGSIEQRFGRIGKELIE